jgi:adenylate cyclase
MLSSKVFPWLRLFQARLSQRLVLWIFASIVFIEIIILIPSYWSEENRQLQNLEDVSRAAVDSIRAVSEQEGIDSKKSSEKLNDVLKNSKVIRGIAIYGLDGNLKMVLGEPPKLSFSEINNPNPTIERKRLGNRYDVAWVCQGINQNQNYILMIRHDASEVQIKLIKFIIRITVLVLIISGFVTFVMTLVLGTTVINPILRLRDDLIEAGEALSQDKTDCQFYSFSVQRQDELGEVLIAFKEMFNRVSWEIKERKHAEEVLRIEQAKSENLLLNILPKPIAEQLKEKQNTIAQGFAEVSILFADIVGFTPLSSSISPEELVELLNQIFSCFDLLTEKYGLEKIKTIGDSYMVAAGLPLPRPDHAEAIAAMALDMQAEIQQFPTIYNTQLQIRIGINTGPVVAGVIGTKKFIYDLWGDAVNIASRMESHGIPGCIQVTELTYKLLQNRYLFKERGCLDIKGRGSMPTYLLLGSKEV